MFYLWLVSVLWALSFKIVSLLNHINAINLVNIRLAIAFLSFNFITKILERKSEYRTYKSEITNSITSANIKNLDIFNLKLILQIGALQYGLMYIFYTYSFRYLKAYEVALFSATTPIFVIIFNALYQHYKYKNIALNVFKFVKLITILTLCIFATLLTRKELFTPSINNLELNKSYFLGIFLVLAANIAFALGQIFNKYHFVHYKSFTAKKRNYFEIIFMKYAFAGALLFSVMFFIVAYISGYEENLMDINLKKYDFIWLLYLGLIPSTLCFYLWNKGATMVDNLSLALMNNTKSVLGAFISALIFMDAPKEQVLPCILAMILLLLSLYFASKYETIETN